MSQKNMEKVELTKQIDSKETTELPKKSEYNLLYKLGAIASLAVALMMIFQLLFIRFNYYPQSVGEWYALFARSRILGLFYLNTLDIISIALLGVMFAALCVRLKEDNKSITAISLPFAFLGIAVFIVPRTLLLSFVSLSNEYAIAADKVTINALLAAGKAISVFGVPTIQTTGFFIISFAAFLLSLVMINSNRMPKAAGFIGIVAFFLTLIDVISMGVAPALATPLLVVAGVFWVVWWLMIAVGLLRAKD